MTLVGKALNLGEKMADFIPETHNLSRRIMRLSCYSSSKTHYPSGRTWANICYSFR